MQLKHRVAHYILTKPQESCARMYAARVAFGIGLLAFAAGLGWLILNLMALRVDSPITMNAKLSSWSDFGQAASAPLALANLGVVIISAYYVVKSLRQAESAVKMGYQPLLACSISLEFDLIGDANKRHVRIAKPKLSLLLRNLGDSPATFVEIELLRITLRRAMQEAITFAPTLRQGRALLDHLSPGGETMIPILELDSVEGLTCRAAYDKHLVSLVSSILMTLRRNGIAYQTADTTPLWLRLWNWIRRRSTEQVISAMENRLVCEIQLAHRNVLALAYKGQGTIAWDHWVMRNSPCDPSQIEFVEDFDDAVGTLDKAVESGRSTKALSDTIGQYLKRSHCLLGVVLHDAM